MMFITKKALPRRTFLRAMGTTIALPFLDSMVPALSARALKPTPRFGFVYIANGVIQNQWTPATTGRRLRADADAAAVRQRPQQDHRAQRPLASAGRHLRRRHRRSSARLRGVAHRRACLRPHEAGRRSEARHHRRSAHRPRDRQDVADPVDRDVRRFPDAGVLRFGRLLLREHRLVAQRDDAEQHRVASADPVRTAVRRRRQRRSAPGAQPIRREHPRLRPRRGEPRGEQSWPGRQGQAARIPRLRARSRAADSERRIAAASTSRCPSVRRTSPPRSTRIPS